MTANVSSRALVYGGITVITAGIIAIGTEVTKATLHEIRTSQAAAETARAETAKAKALMETAIAQQEASRAAILAAQNNLLSAVEARNGATIAAQLLAAGQTHSAEINGKSLIESTEIDRHVDNVIFDGLTRRILVDPSEKMGSLNIEIAQLQREAESGIDRKSRRLLTSGERADRLAQARILEEDIAMEQKVSAKNMGDTLRLIMGGASQGMNGMSGFFPAGNETAPVRKIIVEP